MNHRLDLEHQIFEKRLLVFVETDAQANKYNQVLLNPEQFKKVSDDICVSMRKDKSLKEGFVMCRLNLSDEEYDLPDLQSINT